jgi:hypothetical protein
VHPSVVAANLFATVAGVVGKCLDQPQVAVVEPAQVLASR